jgi:actin-related protein
MYPGIADRMQKELTSLSPSSMKASRTFFVSAWLLTCMCTGQDRRAPGTQILCLDRRIYSRCGFPK